MRFSLSTGGFYPETESYTALPGDLIEIAESDYLRALNLQPGETIDVIDGALVFVPAPAPTSAQMLAVAAAAMTAAVQAHMETQAQAHGYDNLLSAISYADEPAEPTYKKQGLAFRAYRSKVWAKCHEVQAQVVAGDLPIPTIPELLAMLPKVAL